MPSFPLPLPLLSFVCPNNLPHLFHSSPPLSSFVAVASKLFFIMLLCILLSFILFHLSPPGSKRFNVAWFPPHVSLCGHLQTNNKTLPKPPHPWPPATDHDRQTPTLRLRQHLCNPSRGSINGPTHWTKDAIHVRSSCLRAPSLLFGFALIGAPTNRARHISSSFLELCVSLRPSSFSPAVHPAFRLYRHHLAHLYYYSTNQLSCYLT